MAFIEISSSHTNLKQIRKSPFLNVLLIRDSSNNTNPTVYQKSTNNNIYFIWESFAPCKWKWGTLKTIIKRASDVSSSQELLQKDLTITEKIFRANNSYLNCVIQKVLQQVKQQQQQQEITADAA